MDKADIVKILDRYQINWYDEKEFQKITEELKVFGIENPTQNDIGLLDFLKSGIKLDHARHLKENCDMHGLPYEVSIQMYNKFQ